MVGQLIGIWIAARHGEPLREQAGAMLEAGKGIVGDRYHPAATGDDGPGKPSPGQAVTLIESEEIERFNAARGGALDAGAFRRNLVTRGIRLNDLVGRRFRVGAATLEGVEWCETCRYLAETCHRAVLPELVHRAGLRARIADGGAVAPGDAVVEV
jgi:MOSC domain-containing protein YiiM